MASTIKKHQCLLQKEINLDFQHLKRFQMEELTDCRYYYGNLSVEDTNTLMKDKRYGTYLIRNGPTQSKFPLILVIKTDRIHHCMVESNPERTNLKVHFNNPDAMPKRLPSLPLTMSYGLLQSFNPETHLKTNLEANLRTNPETNLAEPRTQPPIDIPPNFI